MTRDEWLRKVAQRLINNGEMDVGDAAAYAEDMAGVQRTDNGRNPNEWDDPVMAADSEIRSWGE